MFLGTQDFDFDQILPNFSKSWVIFPKFLVNFSKFIKFAQILPTSSQILPKFVQKNWPKKLLHPKHLWHCQLLS